MNQHNFMFKTRSHSALPLPSKMAQRQFLLVLFRLARGPVSTGHKTGGWQRKHVMQSRWDDGESFAGDTQFTILWHYLLWIAHTHSPCLPLSLDMPYIGMSGISHLIRSYIYIEHKALWHEIVKRGREHGEHERTYNSVILRNICCTCACWNVC